MFNIYIHIYKVYIHMHMSFVSMNIYKLWKQSTGHCKCKANVHEVSIQVPMVSWQARLSNK